jgi:hypothetical protein
MLLALASGAVVVWRPELFPAVLMADLWLLGYHHVIATFTKLAATAEDRRQHRMLIYGLPFIVLAFVAAAYVSVGAILIVSIYFFWQWYHYTRQSYGISAFYRRKAATPSITPIKLEHAALWSIPVWGLVYRCAQGWDTFLFLPLWTPSVPMWAANGAGIIACTVLAVWGITKIVDYTKGNLMYAPIFFLLSHHVIFFVGYIYIEDITFGWLVANVWHNAQYILFVWLFNQYRFGEKKAQKESPIMYWVCQKSAIRVAAYFLFFMAITTAVYGSINSGISWVLSENITQFAGLTLILYQTINFHHYIVDSIIWKARKKSNQKVMKIAT